MTVAGQKRRGYNQKHLDISALETWLWEAACKIRGPVNVASTKNWILPLIILKRLSDVFDHEVNRN